MIIFDKKNYKINNKLFIIFTITCVNFLVSCHKCQDYWIATDGNDTSNGSQQYPFQTLEKARNAVRANSNRGKCTIHVNLKNGDYRLSEPFVLTGADSGSSHGRVIYQSAPYEQANILGSEQISGWSLHDGLLNIWKAQTNVNSPLMPRQLYVNGVRGTRARSVDYPNYYTPTDDGYNYNYIIGLDPQIPPTWNNPTVVEAVTVTQWKMMRCPIAEVQGGSNVIMQQPCWKNANVFPSPWNFHLLSWWENAYEFLNEPGEWYLDPVSKILYYIPREDEDLNTADVELPILETLVVGAGNENSPIKYINFERLNFMYATWYTPSSNEGYALDQSGFHLIGYDHQPNSIGHDPNSVRTPGNVSFQYAQAISF